MNAFQRLMLPMQSFEDECFELHQILYDYDWYALAGTSAERLLHERLTRLVSCEEFGKFIQLLKQPTLGSKYDSPERESRRKDK